MGDPEGEEENALRARLDKLSDSLEARRKDETAAGARRKADEKFGSDAGKAMSLGFRVLAELIAGILVGTAIGWQLDRWLSTGPWLMFLFLFLGTAAGIFNVIRSANQGNDQP
jgi:ATP synthase protein I